MKKALAGLYFIAGLSLIGIATVLVFAGLVIGTVGAGLKQKAPRGA